MWRLENIYEFNKRGGGILFCVGEISQIIREMTGKNCQITKHGGWNKGRGWKIFMKSIMVEGGFYFVEGDFFQIITEMTDITGKNCQITKHGG